MALAYETAASESPIAGQAAYGMSNLRPASTGLPFIVFVSQKDDARHAARVKWSPAPKVRAGEMGSYVLQPFEHKGGPRLDARGETMLRKWVELNIQTLEDYWNGEIEYTEDMLELIRSLSS